MTNVAHNKTVLVAMTGGVESTVAAYLLKKQGYKCIGIGIQFFENGEDAGPFLETAVLDLNRIKGICNSLDIPFYAVNASSLFAEKVLDPVVGRILSGKTFEPLAFLTRVLFDVLVEKSAKFQTNLIAAAHYAKVLKNQKSGEFEIFVANDLEHDQSYLLGRLEQRHLENLILPLSEIRKKEVDKIGELIKGDFVKRPKTRDINIMHDPRMVDLVESRSSKDLRKAGTIFDYKLETSVGEHLGIHFYHVGQSNLFIPDKAEIKIDPLKEVISIIPFKGKIFIDYPDRLKYQHVLIDKLVSIAKLNTSVPLFCYIKISPNGEKLPCRLYFKNNSMGLVEFDSPQAGLLVSGKFVVFYNRPKEKGKILASALVEVAGMFDESGYNSLPNNREGKNETSNENNELEKNQRDRLTF